jgi:hypothetical protein
MNEIEETGTIDWLVVEFPGTQITGALVPPLLDLVDRRLIRLLDALIVIKRSDGTFESLTSQELDPAQVGELGALAGVSSGLLTDEDAEAAASVLEPDTAALLLVYENLWSIPFAVAARRAGGQVVSSGRIPVQAILARLDALET